MVDINQIPRCGKNFGAAYGMNQNLSCEKWNDPPDMGESHIIPGGNAANPGSLRWYLSSRSFMKSKKTKRSLWLDECLWKHRSCGPHFFGFPNYPAAIPADSPVDIRRYRRCSFKCRSLREIRMQKVLVVGGKYILTQPKKYKLFFHQNELDAWKPCASLTVKEIRSSI